ncbi:MAG: hypothetical protein KA201_38430 [Kofleriaceae bacterium]|jgi:hypothetical protein|nr:hypothetical protein [Kofleriaceae bacterium]
MRAPIFGMVLATTIAISAGCSDDEAALPLVASTVTGTYAGDDFTAVNGFLVMDQGRFLIGLGDGPLSCASATAPEPPSGTNAGISLDSIDPGTYGNVFVNLYHNVGSFSGHGSNSGTVTITASTAASVTATVDWSDTDSDGKVYRLSGGFEVSRCP